MTFYDKVRPVKEKEVEKLLGDETALTARIKDLPEPRSLFAALERSKPAVIAEIKRASPSKGIFCPDLNAASQAMTYERGGASAISVLTEEKFFHGSLKDLEAVSKAVSIPVLRKDFILDPIQVTAARASGADAVLLIAGFLDGNLLRSLLVKVRALGMEALVEIHNREELDRVLSAGARIVGINNRNLKTLTVDLEVSEKLLPLVPKDIMAVVESGIHGRPDVLRLTRAGAEAFLIGEYLVLSGDPEIAIGELLQ